MKVFRDTTIVQVDFKTKKRIATVTYTNSWDVKDRICEECNSSLLNEQGNFIKCACEYVDSDDNSWLYE